MADKSKWKVKRRTQASATMPASAGSRASRALAPARAAETGSPRRPGSVPVAAGLVADATIIAPAQAADVVSSNIVGYNKVSLNNGLTMVGVQFNEVGGGDIPLTTIGVLNEGAEGFDEDGVYATTLRVWNGRGYATYGWAGTSPGEYMDDETLNNTWLDNNQEVPDVDLSNEGAFWISTSDATTMTLSGEVSSAESIQVNLSSGLNMLANPYPAAVKVSDFGKLTNVAGFDEDGNYAATLRVWNGRGYVTYGWSGTSPEEFMDDATLNNMWLDNNQEKPTATIAIGQSVWVSLPDASTITFTSPTAE